MAPLIECYDVGGTKILGALIKDEQIVAKKQIPTVRGNKEGLLEQLSSLSSELHQSNATGQTSQFISVGLPGPTQKGVMFGSKPLELEEAIDFGMELKPFFRAPLVIENDLSMATMAQQCTPQGQRYNNFCLLTLSTGIGVGVVADGQLLKRRTEIGHTTVESDPHRAHSCQGHAGCWVAHASGAGIASGFGKGSRDVVQILDAMTTEELAQVRRYNSIGLGTLIGAYDPECIFVMGSLGLKQFDRLIPSPEEIAAFTILRPIPPIRRTELTSDVGIMGCYYAAKDVARRALTRGQ